MSNPIITFLSTVEPFARLPKAEMDKLAETAHQCRHKKGESIYSEGEEADSVWVNQSGRVDLLKYSLNGKPTAVECILPGEIFGMCCCNGDNRSSYSCTAVAAVESDSIRIQEKAFWELFQQNPVFARAICSLYNERLNRIQELTAMAHDPVQKRIIKTLVQLSGTSGRLLSFTRREIAELSSTTVETTIRTLRFFEKHHWISCSRGRIDLKDVHKLESLL